MSEKKWTYSYISYDCGEHSSLQFFDTREAAEEAAKNSEWTMFRVYRVTIEEIE